MTKDIILFVDNLVVEYSNTSSKRNVTRVLDSISLSLSTGELHVLLGQSGSGKSTLLRAIAGFHQPSQGTISIAENIVSRHHHLESEIFLPPDKRRVGFVFQDYALFPHMTLEKNVNYGANGDIDYVHKLIDMIGLSEKKYRRPDQLSGGERQRVALARSMAMRPNLLLLDEPFSNLDPTLRTDLRTRTFDIVRNAKLASILVTHSPEEAMSVADKISVLSRGKILQTDTPENLYYLPNSLDAAQALGKINSIPMTQDGETISPQIPLAAEGELTTANHISPHLPTSNDTSLHLDPENQTQLVCLVRPNSFIDSPDGLPAIVTRRTFLGETTQIEFSCDAGDFTMSGSTLKEGERFRVAIKRGHITPA